MLSGKLHIHWEPAMGVKPLLYAQLLSLVLLFELLGGDLSHVRKHKYVGSPAFVSLDLGTDPAGLWGSWGPAMSARIRASKSFPEVANLLASISFEYWQYRLNEEFATGMKFVLEGTNVKRHDFSLYGSLTYHYFVVGMGASYITSGTVTFASGSAPPYELRQWEHGNLSKVALYLTVGLETQIDMCDSLFLPLGIYYVKPSNGAERLFTVRLGIGHTF